MMKNRMNAAVVRELGRPLVIEEMNVPTPGPNQVLVRIHATGVCHTDVHAADGDWPVKPTAPFIPGHEGAGVVVEVGRDVRGIWEGDRVGIAWLHDACGACEHCITGWETLCEAQHDSGYSVNGTFAEYALADASYLARLPPNLDFATVAPILCAGVTTYKGIKEAEVRPGEWIAISGIGGLGHVAIQYARAMGLHVVALDVTHEKRALALDLGADLAIDASSPDAIHEVIEKTHGGAHGVLVTAVSRDAFSQAIQLARRHGTISLVGLPPGDFATPIFDVVLKRLTIRGSIVGTRKDLAEALQFAAEGKVVPHIHRARLENINQVLSDLRAGRVDGRVVVELVPNISIAPTASHLMAQPDAELPAGVHRTGYTR